MRWLALAVLSLHGVVVAQEPAARMAAVYAGWQHSGTLTILTTPEGADLPAGATVEGFPLLVRLHRDWFDFTQARAGGEDIRFSTAGGAPLPYQIEEWDPATGAASIWVRIPTIRGNERQTLRMHWGQRDAASESSGSAVFNESNGYLSVWHMTGPVKDEVGTIESTDVGTTPTTGMIGPARHLAGEQGIFGGATITNYPADASPHSSELWFRAKALNGRPLAWGNEHRQGKVVMHFRSPPHMRIDSYFSGANVATSGRMPMNEWVHVVHTYQPGDSRIYVNGVPSGVSTRPDAPLAIRTPARLWIGGWFHNYDFIGDIDEVRISRVARSADWVKLQYENQKAHHTLVGPVVRPGDAFAVSPATVNVAEGRRITFTAQAGGAQKVYWSLRRDGNETVVAVDRLSFQFDAGRVSGDTSVALRFRAVLADRVRTQDIPITIEEAIPDPVFTLRAPRKWNGRDTIEIVPVVGNRASMAAAGADDVKTEWTAGPLAVIKEVAPGKLVLTRAQQSGPLTATATMSNGGKPVAQSVAIDVEEPKRDPWVARTPAKDEKPQDGQFYARDDRNQGTLHYNGVLDAPAEAVFLRLFADGKLIKTDRARPAKDLSYAFAVKLKPGLIKYRVEFGTKTGEREVVLHTATDLVCGDAYLISGQSNALATDTPEKSPPDTHEWIRSYGRAPANQNTPPGNLWTRPVWKVQKGELAELGWWGMELAKRLVESQKIPIFIINAAAGGAHRSTPAQRRQPDRPFDPLRPDALARAAGKADPRASRHPVASGGERSGRGWADGLLRMGDLPVALRGNGGGLEAGLPERTALLRVPDLAERVRHGWAQRPWRHAARDAAHAAAALLQHEHHVHAWHPSSGWLPFSTRRLVGNCAPDSAAHRARPLRQGARDFDHPAEPPARVPHRRRERHDCAGVRSAGGLDGRAGRAVLRGWGKRPDRFRHRDWQHARAQVAVSFPGDNDHVSPGHRLEPGHAAPRRERPRRTDVQRQRGSAEED